MSAFLGKVLIREKTGIEHTGDDVMEGRTLPGVERILPCVFIPRNTAPLYRRSKAYATGRVVNALAIITMAIVPITIVLIRYMFGDGMASVLRGVNNKKTSTENTS